MIRKKIKFYLIIGVLLCLTLFPMVSQAASAEDLAAPSGLSAAEFEDLMPDALKGYGGQIYDMETKYGINGIFLLAVIRLESGNGESRLAQSENNVAGNRTSGGYLSFEVMSDGIEYAAKNLGENYLNKDGKFYVDGTLSGVESKYCPGGGWASQVQGIMNEYI